MNIIIAWFTWMPVEQRTNLADTKTLLCHKTSCQGTNNYCDSRKLCFELLMSMAMFVVSIRKLKFAYLYCIICQDSISNTESSLFVLTCCSRNYRGASRFSEVNTVLKFQSIRHAKCDDQTFGRTWSADLRARGIQDFA